MFSVLEALALSKFCLPYPRAKHAGIQVHFPTISGNESGKYLLAFCVLYLAN